jgi:hypothetical protein
MDARKGVGGGDMAHPEGHMNEIQKE